MNELSKAIIHKNQARVREKLALEFCNSETIERFLELFCFLEEENMFDLITAPQILSSGITKEELEQWILPAFREDNARQQTVLRIMLLSGQFSTMNRQSTFNQLLEIFENPLAWKIYLVRLREYGWYSEAVESLTKFSASDTITIATSQDTLDRKIQQFFDYWARFRPVKMSQYRFWSDNEFLFIEGQDTETLFDTVSGKLNISGIVKSCLASSSVLITSDKDVIYDAIKYKVAAMVVDRDLWSSDKHDALMSYVQVAFDEVYAEKMAANATFSTPQKSVGSSSSSAAFFSSAGVGLMTPPLDRSTTMDGDIAKSEEDNNTPEQAAKKPKLEPKYKLRNRDVGEVSTSTSSAYRR